MAIDSKTTLDNAGRMRLDGVDVLRGLSILLVVLHHIHLRFRLNKYDIDELVPAPVAQVLFWSGYYSVIAFFVISGFLITHLSLKRWGSLGQPQIKHFYRLRMARIAPCLLLLLAILSLLHSIGVAGFVINPERASLGRALLSAVTFHLNWLEGHHGYLPGGWDVLWSLSVEETFYLLFPLVCFLVRSERALVLVFVSLIVVGPFNRVALAGQDPWEDYAYLSCMDGIAFGCMTALAAARLDIPRWLLIVLLTLGCVASLLVVIFRKHAVLLGLPAAGLHITMLELGVALILIALVKGVGNTALSQGTAPLRLIGRCSYEIYLAHMFVVLGLMKMAKGSQQTTATIFLWYLAMLLLSIGLGYVVARSYSEPLNRALRHSSE